MMSMHRLLLAGVVVTRPGLTHVDPAVYCHLTMMTVMWLVMTCLHSVEKNRISFVVYKLQGRLNTSAHCKSPQLH